MIGSGGDGEECIGVVVAVKAKNDDQKNCSITQGFHPICPAIVSTINERTSRKSSCWTEVCLLLRSFPKASGMTIVGGKRC